MNNDALAHIFRVNDVWYNVLMSTERRGVAVMRGCLAGVFVVLGVAGVVAVGGAMVVPAKFFWPAAVVWVLLSLAVGWGIFWAGRERLVWTVVVILLAFVMTAVDVGAILTARRLDTLLANIQETAMKTERYNLIALKTNGVEPAGVIGQLSSDAYTADVRNFIMEDLALEVGDFADPTTLSMALGSQEINSALINDAYLSIYETNLEEFFEIIQVIKTYDIAVSNKSIETEKKSITEPFILYVSGIDVRTHDLPQSARSDVNILVVVNPKTHKILTVNTPRDYYVELASFGARDKLTHAGIYGAEESVKTLEKLYQTKIDYYARVNFDTLVGVVDAIGGVDVNLNSSFTAYHGGYHFEKGWNHLTGASALGLVRERYQLRDGDLGRGQNQQLVLQAIFKKALAPNMITRASSIVDALADSLQTNLGTDNIKILIQNQLDSMAHWQIENVDAAAAGSALLPTYTMGSLPLFIWWPDESSVGAIRVQIAEMLAQDSSN